MRKEPKFRLWFFSCPIIDRLPREKCEALARSLQNAMLSDNMSMDASLRPLQCSGLTIESNGKFFVDPVDQATMIWIKKATEQITKGEVVALQDSERPAIAFYSLKVPFPVSSGTTKDFITLLNKAGVSDIKILKEESGRQGDKAKYIRISVPSSVQQVITANKGSFPCGMAPLTLRLISVITPGIETELPSGMEGLSVESGNRVPSGTQPEEGSGDNNPEIQTVQ
jgi:hypothetical protein